MKFVIYARKSTEDKKRQELSIPAQIDAMQEIAKNNGYDVVKTFTESKSARHPYQRDVFAEMVRFIEEGNANAILCWKVNRLARNSIDEGIIKHMLETGVITLIKTSDREYNSEENAIVTGIEFAQANQYSRDLSKDVTRGLLKKARMGLYPMRPPLGYIKSGEKLQPMIPDPERAHLIRYAFETYAQGNTSFEDLNELLYEKGLRTSYGRKLKMSMLHFMLQNPIYYGEFNWKGETIEGKHKAIVSKETFEQVQSVRLGTNNKRSHKRFFPLRGFLTCHRCGCALTADVKKSKYVYYYCTNGKGNCDAHRTYMRSEDIVQKVATELGNLHYPKDLIELMHDASIKNRQNLQDWHEQEREQLQKTLKQCTERQDRLIDSFTAGKTPESIYERKIKELEQEQKDIERQINKKFSRSLTTFELTKKAFLLGNKAKKCFLEGDDDQKHELLKKVLSNISFDGQKVSQIQYKKAFQPMANAPKMLSLDAMLGR